MDVIVIEGSPFRVEIRNDDQRLHSQECQDYDQATVYANGCVAGIKAAVLALGSLPLGFKTERATRINQANAILGKTVALRGNRDAGTAIAKTLVDDVEGGIHLDKPLDGSRGWNVDDLEVVG
jgi:hypothetical protein